MSRRQREKRACQVRDQAWSVLRPSASGSPRKCVKSKDEGRRPVQGTTLARNHLLHRLDELPQAEGLGQEVEFLALGQILLERVLGVAGDEDHLQVRVELAQLA